MGSDMNPPKEPQPSQGAGAEEEAAQWARMMMAGDVDPIEFAVRKCSYLAGRASQDARIAEAQKELAFFKGIASDAGAEVDSLRSSLAVATGALEKIAGDMTAPLINFGKGKDMIIAVGEWRREQDRTIARSALSQLPGVEKDGERGEG